MRDSELAVRAALPRPRQERAEFPDDVGAVAGQPRVQVALPGQDWYGHQDRRLRHRPLDVLVDLNEMAERRDRDRDRREAARLLWAAFLADLDAAFAQRGSVDWTFNCLAMLDNADAPAGREFLAELVAARRERAADPLLRRLLLRRLAARPANVEANWTTVHSWLRENALAAGDETGALYHALALGEVEHVGRRLAKAVEEVDAEDWLELLEAVTTAPNALDNEHMTVGQVKKLTSWTKPGDLPVAPAGRATAAMWIDTDPLSDPHRPALRQEIRASLHQIAPFSQGIDTLREYADKEYGDDPGPDGRTGPESAPVSFISPKSGRGIRRARRRRALAAIGAIVVTAGAVAGIYTLLSGGGGPVLCPGAPASGPLQVVQDGGECVGVTDGSFIFNPSDRGITEAEQAIAGENAAAVASKQGYVTVALLDVLTQPLRFFSLLCPFPKMLLIVASLAAAQGGG